MDEDVRKRLEYEEQFFDMSSRFFADCFKNLIIDEIDTKITLLADNFKGKLIEQAKNPEKFEVACQKMKNDLMKEYKNAVFKSFPEIEAEISNFIHIPPNVLLKEDLPVRSAITGNLKEITEEVEHLKGKFSSLLYLKQKMYEELEEAEKVIFYMEYIIKGEKFDFSVLPLQEISELSKANNFLINEF